MAYGSTLLPSSGSGYVIQFGERGNAQPTLAQSGAGVYALRALGRFPMIAETQDVFGTPPLTKLSFAGSEGEGVTSGGSAAFLLEAGGQDYVGDNSYDLRLSDGNSL